MTAPNTETRPHRVVVIDDSLTLRRWLGSVIAKDPRLELVGTAGSAQEARTLIKQTNPDVLTLDVEMPEMNGLEFLSHLMRLRPMPVVMVASSMRSDTSYAERARALGAAACLPKPTIPTPDTMAAMCNCIVAAARGDLDGAAMAAANDTDKIILIGASTGGVGAIETVLPQFAVDGPPVVIAQHMPHGFLKRFVERLDRAVPQDVGFARPDAKLRAGQVRIAPAQDMQTVLTWHSDAWHAQQVRRHYDHTFCPSVDVLFASAASWGPQVGAMLLTGLGNDGAKGMLALRRNGARTIGQSRDSCVVYGMPGAALALNATEEECDLSGIGTRLRAMLQPGAA